MTVVARSEPLNVLFDIIFPFSECGTSRTETSRRYDSDADLQFLSGTVRANQSDVTSGRQSRDGYVVFRAQVAFTSKLRTNPHREAEAGEVQ